MTSEEIQLTPSAIIGKVLFESGVTVKNAERMIDVVNRNPGENTAQLVAYFEYEAASIEAFRAENPGTGCIVCHTETSVVNYPATGNRRCTICGVHA